MKKFYKTLTILLVAFSLTSLQILHSQTFTDAGISLTGMDGSCLWGDFDNDGDLDILLSGVDAFNYLVKIYRNNGNGTFSEQASTGLPSINAKASLGDYNNDGYLDIIFIGDDTKKCITKIFRNNGNMTFTEDTVSIAGLCWGSVMWGDYNNDNYLDVLYSGEDGNGASTKLFKNNKDNTFTEQTNVGLWKIKGKCSLEHYDNDGSLDILLSGSNLNYGRLTQIYHNNNDGTFTRLKNTSIVNADASDVAWGDYDNDGYPDILLVGKTDAGNATKIYHNNGDGTFTELTGLSLTQLYSGHVVWGDYDNDGYLDILLTGEIIQGAFAIKVYHNNGNGSFSELTGLSFPVTGVSSVSWGDYDNDGDLDFIFCGSDYSPLYYTKLYRNNTISGTPKTVNDSAAAPANLTILSNQNGNVTFSWDKATDTETPQNGLSYNLYVYEAGQTTFARSPHAFTQTHAKNGRRLVAKIGDIQYSAAGYTLKGLASGNYKWSVQAVDGGLKGGLFSPEQTFNVVNLNKVGVHVASGQLTYTSPGIEYSLNSADGSNGTWAMCSSAYTTVDFATGGFDVWVREHGTPANNRKVATIASPITPAFTIDYVNEKTTQTIADTVEYSTNADMSAAVSGAGAKLMITPGQNLYFRLKATATRVVSAVQTLTVKERYTPSYSIDYAGETTAETVPATCKYSVNADMSSAQTGAGAKIALTPGQTLYFRQNATDTNFVSLVQTLAIPARPATPAYTIDFINETTTQTIPVTDEYAVNSNMSGATAGSGEKTTVTPGQKLYFRTKPTALSFASAVQTLTATARPNTPLNAVVNDALNTFDWSKNTSFPDTSMYEYSTDNGATWNTCTKKPINVGNVNLAAGYVQVRIKASAANFRSDATISNAAFTINVGIASLKARGITLHPNPVSHTLVVENLPEKAEACIFSAEGKLLKTISLAEKTAEIEVSDLAAGIYILKIKSSKVNGETKIVKQ